MFREFLFSVICSLSKMKVLELFYESDLSPSAGAGYPELSASVYKSPGSIDTQGL